MMAGFGIKTQSKSGMNLEEALGLLKSEPPTDYFDFPFSLTAFALSLSSSELFIKGRVAFRKRNAVLTLITYFCTGAELEQCINELVGEGYKVKTLNFANKNFDGLVKKKYPREYWITKDWSFQTALDNMPKRKSRYKRKRELSLCAEKYTIEGAPGAEEAYELFDEWVEGAKPRHFMVIKGHYKKYIEMFYELNPAYTQLLSFRKASGELFGLAGYELFKGQAQITLMKHKFGDANFPLFFWVKTLEKILSDGPGKVFCGTTADDLKIRLGLQSQDSFKVIL